MRKLFLICVLIVSLLTGCNGSKELGELGIVAALGLDKDIATGEFILTTEFIRTEAIIKTEAGSNEPPTEIITTRGKTLSEAVNNINKQFDRQPFLGHDRVIIINEQISREGIQPIIDFFARSPEFRDLAWFTIAKDTTARELLGVKHGLERTQAFSLYKIIKLRNENSEASAQNIVDLAKKLSSEEINPISGVVKILSEPALPEEQKKDSIHRGVNFSGTAVFKKDKLVGYLNETETRGLNWITNQVKTGIINIPSPMEEDQVISAKIKKAHSSITPKIEDGKIFFTIEVKEESDIYEQQNMIDFSKLESLEEVQKEQEKFIEREIKKAIDKAQTEFRSDIFGFGAALNRKYPKEWSKVKGDWQNIFPYVGYEVKVNVKLPRTGMIHRFIGPNE